MKIAIVSDIHGNLAALDAVLADIAKHRVDETVNLGDILSGALLPSETADRLIALQLPTIRGNHERQLLTLPYERMGPSDRHAARSLRPDQIAWLEGLPESLRLWEDVLAVHGTPHSDLTYFLETVTEAGMRQATVDEVNGRASGADAALILCGHSHRPRILRLNDGRLIVNPGSVGLQAYAEVHPLPHKMELGVPHAHYAIAQKRDGCWSAEVLRVAYDWDGAAIIADAHGQSDWAKALRTGMLQ